MSFLAKVGTFAKSVAAATAPQAVTGIGFQCKALLLWTAGQTADGTFGLSYRYCLGMTTGAANSYSQSAAAQDAADTTNASRRIAAKALSIVEWAEVTLAECDLTSFDADGFTLSWTTNNATAYQLHYLALGGDDITGAKALTWNTSTGTGDKTITGAGFTPEFALHVNASAVNSIPLSAISSALMLGATDGSGQWAMTSFSSDVQATSIAKSAIITDGCFLGVSTAPAINTEAAHSSFTSDGEVLNFSANSGSRQSLVLFLAGGRYKVGTTTKSTSLSTPVTDAKTGVGFEPDALLFATIQEPSGDGFSAHARLALGASDGANEAAIAVSDTDALAISSVDAVAKSGKAIIKVDNDTATIDAEADVTAFGSDGWTWSWTTNDAVATQIAYVAFGGEAVSTSSPPPLYLGSERRSFGILYLGRN